VIKKPNVAPVITGQQPLSVNQGQSVTIALSHLTVTDPDNSYPTGFTLKVFGGNNYTFNGTTITPSANFSGQLTVPITVNDGQNESNRFNLKIDVIKKPNVAPVITGQQPLSVNQGGSLTIALAHLTVTDPDNSYPAGFTLKVFPGINFAVTGTTITPSPTFAGTLTASVTVNDGQHESNVFYLKIDVVKIQNVAPQITGQQPLKINEDETATLHLGNLIVTDPDNVYPKDFSLKISEGPDYSTSGFTVTPVQNFSGELTVPVIVNDGKNDSAPFNLKIDVTSVNDAPVIDGQVPLSTNKNTLISLALSDLIVTDPDNKYPEDFTLKILTGDNYTFVGNIVSPAPDFIGILNVNVIVNDGKANSPEFSLKIEVLSPTVNIPPTITGQKPIRITQNTAVTIQLSDLLVSDPDNEYPHGFTLKIFPGTDYTVDGTTVTPAAAIVNETFYVTVTVNDGQNDSPPFQVEIQVVPPTERPQINGQKELTVWEDSTLTIQLTDLIVTDADDPDYPTGFLLVVLSGDEGVYTRKGNSITPAPNLNGFIEVGVIVSDGTNISDEFKLAILVSPVNDPPEFIAVDTTILTYEPGRDPLPIFETVNVRDVDDDHLILAEIGFDSVNYNPINDQCIFPSTTSTLRTVQNADGRLFLIGYATMDDYLGVLRSVQYNYQLSQDEYGNPAEILTGPRRVYLTVFDGHLGSATYKRTITMEIEISLDIPNAFTPNGDRQNDTWHIDLVNADRVDGATIRIYNKRGALLYEAIGFENEWDGSSNGQTLPVDTYYYTIDLNLSYMKKTYKGAVTILH
jgi:gliding motility-associated-like protein